MPTRQEKRITEYLHAFRVIHVPFDNKAKLIVKMLERGGRTEGSICFAIWKEKDTLIEHSKNKDFWKVFGEAVNKWSWAKDDPRWIEYKKKKEAEERAKLAQEKMVKDRVYDKPTDEKMKGFIYFIQGECGGPIKIGYTTDLKARLKTLQTGYPDRLELLFAFPGNPEDEKKTHERYGEYRLQGEWFRPTPELLKSIQKLSYLKSFEFRPPCKI